MAFVERGSAYMFRANEPVTMNRTPDATIASNARVATSSLVNVTLHSPHQLNALVQHMFVLLARGAWIIVPDSVQRNSTRQIEQAGARQESLII